jgi:hypothetical protein
MNGASEFYDPAGNVPGMILEYKGDGTVWCRWTDGTFQQVVRAQDPSTNPDWVPRTFHDSIVRQLKARIDEYERATGFRYA